MRTEFGYFEEKQLGRPYDIKLLARIIPFARPYAALLAGAILLVLGITAIDLALPYVTKVAIDRYIVPRQSSSAPPAEVPKKANPQSAPGQTKEDLIKLRKDDLAGVGRITLVFLGVILAGFVLNFAQLMIMEYTGQMIMHDLRMRLFDHIQHLSLAFFTRNPVGRLVTRVTNDIQNMHDLFTSTIVFVFKDLFLLTGITVVLLSIHWQLALISFTVIPLIVLASVYFAHQARESYRTLRLKVAEINTRFAETIGGLKVIQLFRQEKRNYRRFARLNHENYQAGMRQVHIFAVFMPVIEMLSAVALAIIIYYGGRGVLAESISLGTLVAFIFYMRMFFRPIRDIAEKYNVMQNAMASAERIFLILDAADRIPRPEAAHLPAESQAISEIVVEDVTFGYVDGSPVLRQVSFGVKAGETVAVVGPTGAGKTSLINLLMRFYDPLSGRILFDGSDIRDLDLDKLRAGIALVSQDPFLFSGSIRDNIVQGNAPAEGIDLSGILTAANLKPLLEKLPRGVDTVLGEGGASISSGERQLISIARALARDPRLIILDEATSYIDSETEQKIQEALSRLMAGRTAIVVAHRLSTARGADKIIVLQKGVVTESGTHGELMARKGFYFELTRLQG